MRKSQRFVTLISFVKDPLQFCCYSSFIPTLYLPYPSDIDPWEWINEGRWRCRESEGEGTCLKKAMLCPSFLCFVWHSIFIRREICEKQPEEGGDVASKYEQSFPQQEWKRSTLNATLPLCYRVGSLWNVNSEIEK